MPLTEHSKGRLNHQRAEGPKGPLDACSGLPNSFVAKAKTAWRNGCRNRCPALSFHVAHQEDVAMRIDFSPLYRSTVGFDRMFDMLDQWAGSDAAPNWPPYNIERTGEDDYRITMALAGFAPDEIELVQKENALLVAGAKKPAKQQGGEGAHGG